MREVVGVVAGTVALVALFLLVALVVPWAALAALVGFVFPTIGG